MADFTPRMPEVEVVPDIEERFQQARQDAGDPKERKVAIMTPPRLAMFQDCPKPRTATRDMGDDFCLYSYELGLDSPAPQHP